MRDAIASRREEHPGGARDLPENRACSLTPGPEGVLIRVSSGCLVVTQEGDPEDHVLGPGEELRVAGGDVVVAWAMSRSSFVVVANAAIAAPAILESS